MNTPSYVDGENDDGCSTVDGTFRRSYSVGPSMNVAGSIASAPPAEPACRIGITTASSDGS